MKYKIIITIILFIFSIFYIKHSIYILKENDKLMKTIKEKQNEYNTLPVNTIITNNTIIPGINGKKVNLDKSYNNMKGLNEFRESLLVFDIIKPSVSNIYNKVIVSGNQTINEISIITKLNNDYCYTEDLTIKKECIQNNKYTILIHKINNNYLTNVKNILRNGIIIYLDSINNDELNLVTKYIKNNNYEIVEINKLLNSL